jgi:response regulator NasT
MAMRVLLVDADQERAATLSRALREAGHEVVGHYSEAIDLLARVAQAKPDIIIIDHDSPDRDTLEHVCMVTRDDPRPIVMFTQDRKGAMIREAVKAGVSAYVVDGLAPERLRPILDVAVARFEQHHALRQELDEARASLAERKVIERAKGFLMKQRACSEDEAYQLLRKAAMDGNKRLADVATQLVEMSKLLGT